MAETETKVDSASVESRLEALESRVQSVMENQLGVSLKVDQVCRDIKAQVSGLTTVAEMLREIQDLTRRAAPLLDSPMAKMAQTSAGSAVLGVLGKVRSHGR